MADDVVVLGAGIMGADIAQVCAAAGHRVVLVDASTAALDAARVRIDAALARRVRRDDLTPDGARDLMARIDTNDRIQGAVTNADVVIEAVTEDVGVKRGVWRELGAHAHPEAVLASNTSSLSVTEIASFGGRPETTCGMHFFNPAAVLPLVEVVRGERTSDATLERARSFVVGLGKTPIVCADTPGFIVNRLLIPYVNDAIAAYAEGVATAEDLDAAMTLGANVRIGPLALADLIGLDVTLAAIEALQRETGDPRYRPAPLLRRMVRAGKLGRKSGEGFFHYDV